MTVFNFLQRSVCAFPSLFTISVDKISVGHIVKIDVNQSKLKTELSPIVLAISLCFSDLGHIMVP